MTTSPISTSRPNPFSSRYVRPGARPFLFPLGTDVTALVAQLGRQQWWGAIEGPHGTGKSTLLAALCYAIAGSERRVISCRLAGGERRIPRGFAAASDVDPSTLLVIDGYEQLSRWQRWRLKRLCRRRGAGLLVTTHRSCGLPLLWRTHVDLETAWRVVAELLCDSKSRITRADVVRLCEVHGENLREVLFGLYDLFEVRRRR